MDQFERLIRLLDLESAAEAAQLRDRSRRLSAAEAERSGNTLAGLAIRDEETALGGRVLLTLGKRDRNRLLPWNRLGVGTPVLLAEEGVDGSPGWKGIVAGRDPQAIRIALDRAPEPEQDRTTFRLDRWHDEVARQRQRAALQQAHTAERGRLAQLRTVLLGEARPAFEEPPPLEPLDPALDHSQQEAVRFALGAADVAIIHGPAGTGKTTTVVELIRQAVRRGQKVLACAPSNLAVDNLLERLVHAGERVVRQGHPARVLPELQEHTLDLLVDAHPDVRLARKLIREARQLRSKAAKYTRARPQPGARREMRQEARELVADARRIEQGVVEHLLDTATVVCATLTGLDDQLLGGRSFDMAVIDEAAQSTEPACWIPLLRCRRLVLAGDHCQLPPTIVSSEAAREGFGVSLMERLIAQSGAEMSRRLTVQYRMHQAIMHFSSEEFYEGTLEAAEEVREHRLCDLPDVVTEPLTETPVEFLDTAGAGHDEQLEPDGESRLNPGEGELVARKVRQLLDAGLAAQELAVVTPYAAQARWLRERLAIPGLEVDTVDGFQGREKEAVIISLVRSNAGGEIGFLADVRRMNVALTRARRKLIVVGDSATIASHPFYGRMLEFFERRGAYRTVWEET